VIGLYDNAINPARKAISYNGLTLNNPADPPDDTYEINTVVYGSEYDQTFDSDPASDGTEVGNVRRTNLIVRMDGTLRAPTMAKFFDKRKALAAAFDPALAAYRNAVASGITPANWGVLPMDFSTPTEDTATYASGFVPARYYARSRRGVYIPTSQYTGLGGFFTAEMVVPEARRYLQTTSSLAVTGSNTLDNSLADYPSFPTITITATGAGSTAEAITRVGTYSTEALVLNLSTLANGNVVTIDMKNKRIWVGTTETPSLYVSGVYWAVEPTSQTITLFDATNVSVAVVWRRAWAA